MRISLRQLRKIISEVIGRNMYTTNNDPYSWKDYPGINIEHYASPVANGYYVQVTVDKDPSLSTPLRLFATEEDAMGFARHHVDNAHRILTSKGELY